MKKSVKIVGIVFFLLVIADVVLLAFGNEHLPRFIKPFLMPTLAAAAMLQLLPEHKNRMTLYILIALIFHTIGDVMLMYDHISMVYFAFGLAAFLVGQWYYIIILNKGIGAAKGWKEICCCVLAPMFITPLIISIMGVGWPFNVPVLIYGLSLMFVATSGLLWHFRGRKYGMRIFIGGILFIISDGTLAFNTFADVDFLFRHAFVMLTYTMGEFLIVSGMVKEMCDSQPTA